MTRFPIMALISLLIFCAAEGASKEPVIKVFRVAEVRTANLLQNGHIGKELHAQEPFDLTCSVICDTF